MGVNTRQEGMLGTLTKHDVNDILHHVHRPKISDGLDNDADQFIRSVVEDSILWLRRRRDRQKGTDIRSLDPEAGGMSLIQRKRMKCVLALERSPAESDTEEKRAIAEH